MQDTPTMATQKKRESKMDEAGLRFTSHQVSGSPFSHPHSHTLMSCFLCGVHKQRSHGQFRKVAGKNVLFCFDCKPAPKAATA